MRWTKIAAYRTEMRWTSLLLLIVGKNLQILNARLCVNYRNYIYIYSFADQITNATCMKKWHTLVHTGPMWTKLTCTKSTIQKWPRIIQLKSNLNRMQRQLKFIITSIKTTFISSCMQHSKFVHSTFPFV